MLGSVAIIAMIKGTGGWGAWQRYLGRDIVQALWGGGRRSQGGHSGFYNSLTTLGGQRWGSGVVVRG